MAASPWHLEFGLSCLALTTGLPSISAVADIAFRQNGQSGSGVEGMAAEWPPESLWQDFLGAPTHWWDKRRSKRAPQFLEIRHRFSKVLLQQPAWADLQLAALDAVAKKPPESVFTSGEGDGTIEWLGEHGRPVEIGMSRKLCENGRISDAVDSLNLRVQQGCHVHNNLFYVVLKRCIALKNLDMGRRIHALTIKSGYAGDAFLATHLISLYASCGTLEEAMQVFAKVSIPTVYNWTTIIFAYAKHGEAAQAIRLYGQMLETTSITPDNRLYVAVLKACAAVGDLVTGKEVHAHVLANPEKPDGFVQAGLVNMYAKCGSLGDARMVFDRLPDRTVVTWTALIAGYTQQGMGEEALLLYSRMQHEGLTAPNSVTFLCVLQACASVGVGAVDQGMKLHAEIEKRGLEEELVLGGSLVNMYAKCGSLGDARSVFDRLPEKDVVTWTALIAGYTQQGMGQEALSLYSRMQQQDLNPRDSVTYNCLLQACASVGVMASDQGKQLHVEIEEQGLQEDVVLGASLVNMYAKCGSLEDARRVFDGLAEKDVVTWNSMLAGYAQEGMGQVVLTLYTGMQQEGITAPDCVTFLCLLKSCEIVGALTLGKQLHAQIEERGFQADVVVGAALIKMYAHCGSLMESRRVFNSLPKRDVLAWTALIAGYTQHGMGQEALSLYSVMKHEGVAAPNSLTYVCLLQACASLGVGAVDQGKHLHAEIEKEGLEEDLVLGGSLVNMYAKCGSLGNARRVFDQLPRKDVVTWTSLIAGYAQQGMGQEALSLYNSMEHEGLTVANSVTYCCLLQACACVAALPLGKQLHAQIEDRGLQGDVTVGAGLVNMYAKCGSMFESQQVFDSLPERSIDVWNALTSGYARQGDSEVVFHLVDRMGLEGIQPDDITFLSLLTVCSHVGQVDKGRKYFEAMESDHGISPTIEHYTCMVDLLGRAGRLDEALRMATTMPFQADITVWHTLLGACQKWKNVEIGQQAFEFAVGVDGQNCASFVLMANIYASTQMWEEAEEMQTRRLMSGARKKPGQSWWTDMGGLVHSFQVGEANHPQLIQLVPNINKAECTGGTL